MADEDTDNAITKAKTIIFFVAPYCVGVGLLYLSGYWSVFDLNILQFAGLTDIVASALFPVGFGMSSLAIGMLLGELYSRKTGPVFARALPPPERARAFLLEYGELLFGIYLCVFIMTMMSDWQGKWQVFPLFVAWPVAFFLIRKEWIILPYVSPKSQVLTLFLIIWILPWAFSRGNSDAVAIKFGHSYSYVVSATAVQPLLKDRSPELSLRFVGHVGEYDFFYDPSATSITIAKVQKDNVLTIRKFVRSSSSPSFWELPSAAWGAIKRLYLPGGSGPSSAPSK